MAQTSPRYLAVDEAILQDPVYFLNPVFSLIALIKSPIDVSSFAFVEVSLTRKAVLANATRLAGQASIPTVLLIVGLLLSGAPDVILAPVQVFKPT